MREVVTTAGGTETVTYLTGPRGPEYRRSSDGTIRWYVYDGLGSVIGEVDQNGDLKSAGLADVYGFARSSWKATGETVSRHQFVGGLGHVSDEESNLVYMRARYMDPALGRFVSEDPAGDGNNWFVYADNDPVNRVDASGKSPLAALNMIASALTALGYHGALPPWAKHLANVYSEIVVGADAIAYTSKVLGTGGRIERLSAHNPFAAAALASRWAVAGTFAAGVAGTMAIRELALFIALAFDDMEAYNAIKPSE